MTHEHGQAFIPDHFSRATLVKELQIENMFLKSHAGEIISDSFWTKVEASYNSNHAEFLRLHACPLLDHILKRDKLECDTSPSVPHTEPGEPTSPVCPVTPVCTPHAVPEPSALLTLGIGIIAVFVFAVTKKWVDGIENKIRNNNEF
jgi:hypothetical protein